MNRIWINFWFQGLQVIYRKDIVVVPAAEAATLMQAMCISYILLQYNSLDLDHILFFLN